MKTTYKIMKLRARQSLQGHYGVVVGSQILMGVLLAAFVFIFEVVMMILLVAGALWLDGKSTIFYIAGIFCFVAVVYLGILAFGSLFCAGYMRMFLEIAQARPTDVGDIFYAFKNRGFRFIGLFFALFFIQLAAGLPFGILFLVMTAILGSGAVWITLLGYVPMIWILLQYSQSMYLMIENPDTRISDCLRESRRMMQGNKCRLLLLWLSFVGWIPLIYLSMGIGALWVIPYLLCTLAHFYLSVRMEQQYGESFKTEESGGNEWTTES